MENYSYCLDFIKEEDFTLHVKNTINEYKHTLRAIDLKKFNSNIVDPIKLLFDKEVYNKEFEEIINFEIQRQRDKSNTNIIGYFHQNLFKYLKNCKVPKEGWDVIFLDNKNNYYIELKNKHNTMNSSSSASTYIKMQNHLLTSKDKEKSICALVEIIAKKSQNIPWTITIGKVKQKPCDKLRRISIDKFYEIVTGDKQAFKKLCFQLPITIKKILKEEKGLNVEKDRVLEELKTIDEDILLALYKLAFSTYEGFNF